MVRFGIVGTNWITEKLINAGSMCEDFQLNAVYSRTEEKGREFAEKYKVENIYTDLLEMAKSGMIDAVYIASPNSFHYEQSKLFLENKIAVLCEKPLSSNSFETNDLIKTAKENNTCACSECGFMKMNTLQKVYDCLVAESPEINVPQNIIEKALIPIERMLELSK